MTPEQLSDVVRSAVAAVVQRGALTVAVPDEAVIERPKNPEHGDYATNVALRLAKGAGRRPREVAELLATELRAVDGVAAVDVAGPGFLNITLAKDALGQLAVRAVTAGEAYGHTDTLAGRKLNLESVSANPTGPGLSLASCRFIPTAITAGASRVASGLLRVHAVANIPAGSMELVRSSVSIASGLPPVIVRSAPATTFSGPAQRSLRLRPARSRSRQATLYIESSDSFVASAADSTATGWSEPVPGRSFTR